MASVRATMRTGYYVAKILPEFLWLPVELRRHLRRATDAFEDQLRQSGLDVDTAHELARTYREANRQVIRNIASPTAWARYQRRTEP